MCRCVPFFDLSAPSMRKAYDGGVRGEKEGGKQEKRKEKKIMAEIVAPNVVASPPPKRRPTGMPTIRANLRDIIIGQGGTMLNNTHR